MKDWQWASIMWALCMISFYLSGRDWEPLIAAFIFAMLFGFFLIKDLIDE